MSGFSPNDGSRPSRLMLARLHTGELSETEAAEVQAAVDRDPDLQAFLAELDDARDQVPPLDMADLQRRIQPPAVRQAPATPEPANRPRWHLFLPLIVAALVLLALVPMVVPNDPVTEPYVGVRGEPTVFVRQLIGGALREYDGRPLGAGDTIGISVHPDDATGVVVVSVDGTGQANLLYPENGVEPEPLLGDGRTVALPGTLILDDAPGPEVIIAVFDMDVPEALSEAADRYDDGGLDALLRWSADDPSVDVAIVERQ